MTQILSELIVPKPGQKVKDINTGEFGEIEYYKYRSGEATFIPVRMESGRLDKPNHFSFPRRYEVVDDDSEDYKNHLEVKKINKELLDREKELHNIGIVKKNSQAGLKELPSLLKIAMQDRINALEKEEKSLEREVKKLQKRQKELS